MKSQNKSAKTNKGNRIGIAGFSKRWLPVAIGSVLVLLIIAGIVMYFVFVANRTPANPGTNNPQTSDTSPSGPVISESVQTAIDEANQALDSGNVDDGVAIYQKAIENTSDKKEKSDLLYRKAEFLSIQGDNQAALPAALEAHEASGGTVETASMVAMLYEMEGDNANAATYYRLTADYLDKMSSDKNVFDTAAEAAYYRELADQLEGK